MYYLAIILFCSEERTLKYIFSDGCLHVGVCERERERSLQSIDYVINSGETIYGLIMCLYVIISTLLLIIDHKSHCVSILSYYKQSSNNIASKDLKNIDKHLVYSENMTFNPPALCVK